MKIDNFVPNRPCSKIGLNTQVTRGVIISGNAEIGKCLIGPNATISNALKIGDNVFISLGCRCYK